MNVGKILGIILIISGIILSVALIVNRETSNYTGVSTFFSAYAGICFSLGVIILFKTREKTPLHEVKLGEIRVFSERN
jgi:uncharacterized membrane protein HdeD (DUF308 family)